MQLDRLEIAGFLHFAAPAVLDLREIPPGLVAIVGENGVGKTRLLDGGPASLYGPGAATGAFPSRDGTLATYATTRTAYLDALWSIDGLGRYRARIDVDGTRRTSKAVLYTVPIGGREIPLNPGGNVTTFKDAVARIFPSQQQLLASAYAAQGRQGSFVGLSQKQRLELFAEMIGLNQMAVMSATAKTIATVAERVRSGVVGQLDVLARATSADIRQQLAEQHDQLTREQHSQQLYLSGFQDQIKQFEATRSMHVAAAARHLAAAERVLVLTAAIAEKERDLARADEEESAARDLAASDSEIAFEAFQRSDDEILRTQAKSVHAFNLLISSLHARIVEAEVIVARSDQIQSAVAVRAVHEARLVVVRRDQREMQTTLDAVIAQAADVQRRIVIVDAKQQALTIAQRQAETIDVVPCHGEGSYVACQFLTDAATARAAIEPLRIEILAGRSLADQHQELLAQADEVRQSIDAYFDQIREDEAALSRDTLSKLAPDLDVAVARIADYRDQEQRARQIHDADLASWKSRRNVAEQAQKDADTAAQARYESTRLSIGQRIEQLSAMKRTLTGDVIQAKVEEIETRAAQDSLDQIDADLTTSRAMLTQATASVATIAAQIDAVAQQEQTLAQRQVEHTTAIQRLSLIDEEWLAWRLLAQALGRDGLPKLEIDCAGPTVSQLTNSLLEAGFGTRFTVDLTTQVATADGKGLKEEFTIAVFDNQYGHALGDISDLSGGERVIVEEALRSGILLFNNSRQQRPIRTLWRDETTGALDPANVPRYLAMLRRLHDLGGFRHTLFVTHAEAAAELADTVIRVSEGVPHIERAA